MTVLIEEEHYSDRYLSAFLHSNMAFSAMIKHKMVRAKVSLMLDY